MNKIANEQFGFAQVSLVTRLKFIVIAVGLVMAVNAISQVSVNAESVEKSQWVSTHARKANFIVPPDPLRYHEESREEETAWIRVVDLCTPIDTKKVPSNLCMSALNAYYVEQPIWEFNDMYYYDDMLGLRVVGVMKMNRRDRQLPFSYADYAMGEYPRWSDIFDGLVQERQDRFLQVTTDISCTELSDRNGGVHEEMNERCSAREMYKYAAYLDACVTASQRIGVLNIPHSNVQKFGNASTYEVSTRIINQKIEDQSLRDLAMKRLRKGYLHAHWVINQCTPHGYVLLPNSKLTNDDGNIPRQHSNEFLQTVWNTHDVALTIATRSADEWAIRSYPLGIGTSDEIHKHVRERFPLLMHRFLGSTLAGFDDELTLPERNQHNAQAFLLLKELAGQDVAQTEFDRSHFQDEIDYVLNGGELKYPPPFAEILEKRAAWIREEEQEEILIEAGF